MTQNVKLLEWVNYWKEILNPKSVHWCDGSETENQMILDNMVSSGSAVKLNEDIKPNSYYFQTDDSDVARIESRTFICSNDPKDAGPTNNWESPKKMKEEMMKVYRGAMKGRTMYVMPFSMGPLGSDKSYIGVQLTDSPYVVVHMRIMTRLGKAALDILGKDGTFIPCIHSVGYPLEEGQKDVKWPCCPIEEKYICQFPETKEIWSFGSGYGGNALLGKKSFALRIASVLGKEEGWLAEHMLILGITNPKGEKKYVAAAFPSACGKTNLAMVIPTIPGWKVETVGDDIAWMKFGKDGRLWAVNPENGFFGVVPQTSMDTNPNAFLTIQKNTLFTNVGLTPNNDVWWEGIGYDCPEGTLDWKNKVYDKTSSQPCAQSNSRFTTPIAQCPVVDPAYDEPNGVPISAILFGGRRQTIIPLIYEAKDWNHGVMIGSLIGSEITSAAIGLKEGDLRNDPFAMKPFCGYNMGDYFQHWIDMGKKTDKDKLPKIFCVNWFRKENGKFLWPGYGENSRILAYVFDRCNDEDIAIDSPIGKIPKPGGINIEGLDITEKDMEKVMRIDKKEWEEELSRAENFYNIFTHLPKELRQELKKIKDSF
ncbi:MAG: phosphoenolpyruvate carboxykinase (GTP) [Bacteroidales bacterium]|nr:phosphoenolpyruvate carboxykinase (GTP) [Bacteroidales bacterium]